MAGLAPLRGLGRSIPVVNRLSCRAEAATLTDSSTGYSVTINLLALLLVILTLAACARVANPRGGSGATVAGDVLYTGSEEGEIVALDRDTGDFLWNYQLGGEEESERGVYGTPAVADDTLYVGGYDSVFYALSLKEDDEEGRLKWRSRSLGGPIVGGPAVAGDLVLVGSSDGSLYAFNTGGEETIRTAMWRFPTGDKVWSTPTLVDGVAYFGSMDHKVYAVGLAEGNKLWEFPTKGAVVASPLVLGGRVYVGSFDSNFYAIDAATGAEVWRFEGATKWYWAQAAATDGTILAPSLDGNVYALDRATGALNWTMVTEGPIVGTPAVINGLFAVPSVDGYIRIASLRAQEVLHRCNVEQEIRTPLVTFEEDDDYIYFGARDHSIRAMRIKSNGSPVEEWAHYTESDTVERWVCVGPT